MSGDESVIRQEREHCDQANHRAERWRARYDEARIHAAQIKTERDALAAKVERVEALATEWDRQAALHPDYRRRIGFCADDIRAALGDHP